MCLVVAVCQLIY